MSSFEHPLFQRAAAFGYDPNAPLTWKEWRDEFRATMKYPIIFFIVLPTVLSVLLCLVGSGKITFKVVSKETQRTCAAMCYLSSVLLVFSGFYFFIKKLPSQAEINERKYLAQRKLSDDARLHEHNPDSLEARQVVERNPLDQPANCSDACLWRGGSVSLNENDLMGYSVPGNIERNLQCDNSVYIEEWRKEVRTPVSGDLTP